MVKVVFEKIKNKNKKGEYYEEYRYYLV